MAISLIDLMQIYGLRMRWLMRSHDVVVCDRYLLDTLVDFSVRFPGNQVEKWWLWQLVMRLSPVPDRSFFLRTSVETSNKRLIANNDPASEYPINLAQRLEYYDVLAEQNEWTVLNGEDDVNAIEARILTDVLSTLEQN